MRRAARLCSACRTISSMPMRGIASFEQTPASTSPGTAMSTINGGCPSACAPRAARARLDSRSARRRPLPSAALRRPAARGGTRRAPGAAPWRSPSARGFVDAAIDDREVESRLWRATRRRAPSSATRRARRCGPACARCARVNAARRSRRARRPSASLVPPRTRPAMRSASSKTNPKLGPQRPSSRLRSWQQRTWPDDLGLADGRPSRAPRPSGTSARPRLRLARRASAARLRRARPRGPSGVANASRRRSCTGVRVAAREDQLDAVAGGEIGELGELQRARNSAAPRQLAPAAARTRPALRCRLGATRRRPIRNCSSNAWLLGCERPA